ncbi:hypothetical protein J2129_001326 [Methanofollis sp. W23]|uniref:hypothetical protein n=1 Tax=Methanofollis sp. W23 TaxID=2817849 RepID=UPI001AE20F35|nr:hypothetical protein [Methanofollis sp. W23]MBP2145872.1 hypothetical protein [Methanofollis sp. W23]
MEVKIQPMSERELDNAEDASILCISASKKFGEFKLSCKPKKPIFEIIFTEHIPELPGTRPSS